MVNSTEVLQKVKNRTIKSSISTSGYLPKDNKNINLKRCMHPNIHCSIIYNSQGMKATSSFMDRWMNKEEKMWDIWIYFFHKNILRFVTISVQFSCSVMSNSLWPHESKHARPPCPSPTPGFHSNSHPSSWWCHPAISSSVVPFSSCSQSLPASGSFPMSQLFAWGGQNIGVSALASVLPKKSQGQSLEWTGWISLQSKGLSRVFSNTTIQKHHFFGAQLSSQSNSHIHTWLLEKPEPWLDRPLLAK